ncbi:MAG: CotH kinase family protein [Bacteroidales bacterium]|nr:CotH kinase family protein [Bacteroidales bacterium]
MKRFFYLFLFLVMAGGAFAQSSLPAVSIVTDGPIVNTPAVHGTISVTDTAGMTIVMHAGFKIRGTSSQQYEKKSYRVELWADETGAEMIDTTFLGLRSDDDWNLEAMWSQPLRLRDKVANELWMEMYQLPYLENEPSALPGIRMEYVDLYVNEVYMGVYALTERMDRKQLGLRKYNGNIRGLLFKGNGEGAPTFESLPAYDNASDTWDNYEWVYPNESDTVIDWSSLYNFTNFVMNSTDYAFYSQYGTMFDVNNAIDYYLFINVLKAMDNMGRNLFVARYKKSSAFLYMPWDLDAVWGLDTDGAQTHDAEGLMGNGFYDRLLGDCNANGFSNMARNRYNALRETILTREHIMELVQNQYDALVAMGAYEHEHEAWPEYEVDESQLAYMSDWLDARFAYLDEEINSACGTWSDEEITETKPVEVFPNPATDPITIRFSEDGEAVVRIYDMTGRLVYSTTSPDQELTISTQGVSSGIYSVLILQKGKQFTERILINSKF